MRRIRSGRTRVLSKRGPSRRHFVPPTRMPARTSRSTSTIRNSRVSRSGRPYVEAKPRSPRVFPGLEITSRDRIREIAAEAREAPLRRRYPLNLLPLRGDNRRDRGRYWVRRVRQRSSCASRAFAHQGRPGEHSASEGCLRLISPTPAVREQPARSFHLVDDPGETDRQRIGVVHRLLGNVACPAESMIEAYRKPGFLVIEIGFQHKRMHDREDACLAVVLDFDLARIPEQPPNGFAKPARNHHRNESVDLSALEHRLQPGY